MNTTLLFKSAPLLLAGSLVLFGASTAHAQVTLNYAVSDFSFTAPTGDASFTTGSPSTQSVTLTPGVADTVNFQSVFLDVFPTSDNGDDYTGSVLRNLTIGGVTNSISQGYDLTTAPADGVNTLYANDSLAFTPGEAVIYNLGSKGTLTFTPELMDGGGIFNADSGADGVSDLKYTDNVKGTFLLTASTAPAVPEASTTVSLGLLLSLGGLGLLAARRRKLAAV